MGDRHFLFLSVYDVRRGARKLTPIVSDEAEQPEVKQSAEPKNMPAPVVRGLLKN